MNFRFLLGAMLMSFIMPQCVRAASISVDPPVDDLVFSEGSDLFAFFESAQFFDASGNTTSLIPNPYFLEQRFQSSLFSDGANTPEQPAARLTAKSGKFAVDVPEPSTLMLLGCAMSGLRFRRRQA